MFYLITIILAILGIAFTILATIFKDHLRVMLYGGMAIVAWLAAMPASAVMSIPYAIENSANPGTVITDSFIVSEPTLVWMFFCLALVVTFYIVGVVFIKTEEDLRSKKGER